MVGGNGIRPCGVALVVGLLLPLGAVGLLALSVALLGVLLIVVVGRGVDASLIWRLRAVVVASACANDRGGAITTLVRAAVRASSGLHRLVADAVGSILRGSFVDLGVRLLVLVGG